MAPYTPYAPTRETTLEAFREGIRIYQSMPRDSAVTLCRQSRYWVFIHPLLKPLDKTTLIAELERVEEEKTGTPAKSFRLLFANS